MTPETKTTRKSVTLPVEVWSALDDAARIDGRSTANLLRLIVVNWLSANDLEKKQCQP